MSIRSNTVHHWSLEERKKIWHLFHVENKNIMEIAKEFDARTAQIQGQVDLLRKAYEFHKTGMFD